MDINNIFNGRFKGHIGIVRQDSGEQRKQMVLKMTDRYKRDQGKKENGTRKKCQHKIERQGGCTVQQGPFLYLRRKKSHYVI